MKLSGDTITVRLQKENEAYEDPVLGFIANRTVFSRSIYEDSFKDTQWRRVQGILQESRERNLFCDLTLVVRDGSITLNRLISILIIPSLLQCGSHDDLEVILLPDFSKGDIEELLKKLFQDSDNSVSREVALPTNGCVDSQTDQLQEIEDTPENDLPAQVFPCQDCPRKFDNLYTLVSHEVEEHAGAGDNNAEFEPVTCFRCEEVMTTGFQLSNHKCSLTKYSPTRCVKCRKILTNRTQMISHRCTDPNYPLRGENDTICLSCGKKYATVRRAIIHEVEECGNLGRRLHPDFRLKIFNCDKCQKHFVVRRKYNLHMERHQHNDIENRDPDNNKATSDDETTGQDDKVKEDFMTAVTQLIQLDQDKTASCRHCDKTFSSKKLCRDHEVRIHCDLSFKCDFCTKLFASKALRDNHMTSHTGVRRHQCHICAQQFKTRGNLRAHMGSCHAAADLGMEKKYKCKFCPKTFRFQAHILQHERSHTKEKPYTCHLCYKAFTVKCNLKAHMETHKSLDERSFKCDQCEHRATSLPLLKLHQYNHTGERPFVCDLCGESYKRPHNLRRHKKSMCKLRPGFKKQGQFNLVKCLNEDEEELYERIETVVVQGEEEGDIIIETEQYEQSTKMFVDDDTVTIPDMMTEVITGDLVEEGIVEVDGIKYETPIIIA